LWLGDKFFLLGDQIQSGVRAIREAMELALPSGFELALPVQLNGLHWTGILGGIFLLWLLVNRILIGGTSLHRSRVS
ncbi:MAG: hypothetical protein PVG02_03360, partial [Anaerolineales bacterium]